MSAFRAIIRPISPYTEENERVCEGETAIIDRGGNTPRALIDI